VNEYAASRAPSGWPDSVGPTDGAVGPMVTVAAFAVGLGLAPGFGGAVARPAKRPALVNATINVRSQ